MSGFLTISRAPVIFWLIWVQNLPPPSWIICGELLFYLHLVLFSATWACFLGFSFLFFLFYIDRQHLAVYAGSGTYFTQDFKSKNKTLRSQHSNKPTHTMSPLVFTFFWTPRIMPFNRPLQLCQVSTMRWRQITTGMLQHEQAVTLNPQHSHPLPPPLYLWPVITALISSWVQW